MRSTSHDAVSDYLRREKMTPRILWEITGPRIADGPEAYLIIDDSVQNKRYSQKTEVRVGREVSGNVR